MASGDGGPWWTPAGGESSQNGGAAGVVGFEE